MKHYLRILFFIATALLCLQHLPAAAETVSIIADQDACIDKVCPDCVLGGDWRALVSGAAGTPAHGLFHFDLSSLSATARIDSASLVLCVHSKTMVTTYWAYPLLRTWEEDSASWNEAAAGTPWNTAGGDYDAGRVSTCALPASAPGWASIDVTSLVRDDQGRLNSEIAQNGFLVKSDRNYSKIFTHEFSSFGQARTCHSCHGVLAPERDEGKSTDCAQCHKKDDVQLHGDPTLVVTYTDDIPVSTPYRCAAMHDTTIEKSSPGLNQGSAAGIAISGDAGGTEVRRGLLRFNIPSFISAGQITRAVLYLYGKADTDAGISIYPVTAGWFEKDRADPGGGGYLSYGATWNNRGGEDNATGWTDPGGDYDAAAGTSATIQSGWNEIDTTGFVSSNLDRLRRFGMLLKASDEAGGTGQDLGSREEGEHAPYLELTVDAGLENDVYFCPTLADVYIDAGGSMYPERTGQNFNDKTRVLVSWHPNYGAAHGLWKFEIPADIESSRIDNATLFLSGAEHAMNYNKLQIDCYALNGPFNEEEDTWNSLFGGDYDSSVVSSGALCQEILSGGPVNWRARIAVTELLVGNLDKVRTNGMLIKSAREGSLKQHQNMASREAYDATDMAAYLKIRVTSAGPSTTTTMELSSTTTTVDVSSTTTVDNETSSTTSIAVTSTTTIDNATSTTTTTTIIGTSTTTSTTKDFGSPPRTTTTSSVLTTSTTSTVPAPVTTTIPEPPPEATTTSTVAQGSCPIEQVLTGRPEELSLMRRLRDERMTTSKTGLLLVTLYYTYGMEVSRILHQQPGLQAASAECLDELLPAVTAGLQSGRTIVLTPEKYARAVNVLRSLQAAGSEGLQQVINFALQKFGSGEFLDVVIIQSHDN